MALEPQSVMTRPASASVSQRIEALREAFRSRRRVLVAFSGGVDSAILAKIAFDELGSGSLAAILDSETFARSELEGAVKTASEMGVPHLVVRFSELRRPDYALNPVNRCFICREEMSVVLRREADERGFDTIAAGVNVSDLGEWRPGIAALRAAGVWMPLVEQTIDKQGVRDIAAALGLSVANKPSMACLSSRIPYGDLITVEKLTLVERAETAVRALGFAQVRVRLLGDVARVEVTPEDVPRLMASYETVRVALESLGFSSVVVDGRGYRSGSLNEGVAPAPPVLPHRKS
ncbi:MAG: ATP-dependent sacrificial sulfur transferase LarE [Euryarchaeota archaeon]|nr:ATP-dependent sacrificial sulfur transferase LarE [Euryarchaeota archaeon]